MAIQAPNPNVNPDGSLKQQVQQPQQEQQRFTADTIP
jgi:hypothetical protein